MSPQPDPPQVVTALRYDSPAVVPELAAWCNGEVVHDDAPSPEDARPPVIWVPTDKGPQPASLGDWIVRRGWGDYYPCSQEDFAALHEPAD